MATVANQIQKVYIGLLGRAADAAGLAYWVDEIESGVLTLEQLRANIVNEQPEYAEGLGQMTRSQVVNQLYLNLFNRPAESEGLDYWVNGGGANIDVDQLVLALIDGAQAADTLALDNRAAVADYYTEAAGENYSPGAARQAILDVDGSSSLTAARANVDALLDGSSGEVFNLTASADTGANFVGTLGDDTFKAPITTIDFANGNTLNTGDVLNGNGGTNTLEADLINDGFFQSGLGAVRPSTENIQNVEITALSTSEADSVTLDAANMYDVEHIGSYNSNASLVIQDLHTKTSGGGVRNTESITIRMDHTQNVNSNDNPSDLTVLFDENYLLSGQDAEGKALYWLLDQDADLVGDPLLDNINVDGIRFSIDGGETIVLSSPDAMAADTHVEFVAALQAELNDLIAEGVVPAGTTLELDPDQSRTTFLDDGSVSSQVPAIVLTTGDGAPVTPIGYNFVEDEPGEFNLWARFDDTFGVEDLPVTSNIELHKVGRGSEGGDLIVGGKSQSDTSKGVEVFNVTVMGDESKPSHVGVLNSTNGDLRTVNVTTDAAVTGENGYADLTIGNLGGWKGGTETEPTYAATDVQNFNSTTFEGNLNLYTELNESGNGAHVYNLGGGNDTLNMMFGASDELGVFGGIAGDSLAVSTGAGNDTIMMANVGEGSPDLESMVVNAGSGDNTVYFNTHNNNALTDGEGARIVSGSGDDAIFLNGTTYTGTDDGWEVLVNGIGGTNTPDNLQLFEGKLKIDVGGVESLWVDVGYNNNT